MKSITLIVAVCLSNFAQAAPSTQCKSQILHAKSILQTLEETMQECKSNMTEECHAAIGVNWEAALGALEYASAICPKEWASKIKQIETQLTKKGN